MLKNKKNIINANRTCIQNCKYLKWPSYFACCKFFRFGSSVQLCRGQHPHTHTHIGKGAVTP